MMIRQILYLVFFACGCAGCIFGQSSARASRPAKAPEAQIIALQVPIGTPIQVALDREVRVKKAGQPLHGRVVQPVYVFDHLVIPVGTEVEGRIAKIDGPSAGKRTLALLNADFTPDRQIDVEFNDLRLADGNRLRLDTFVAPGSGQVIRLTGAGDNQKQKSVRDSASQKLEEAKQEARRQWQNALRQVEEPGKMHRLVRYGAAQLPVHPQYIDAGTLYWAELREPLDFGSEPLTNKTTSTIGTPPPAGSLLHARLVTPLSSATTQKGAEVEAVCSQPLFNGNRLIVPQGSRLKGSVIQVRSARHFERNGQLRIAFNELVLPDGIAQRVDTSLEAIQTNDRGHVHLDSEGGAHATSSNTRYLSTGVSVSLALVGSGGRRDVGEAGPVAGGATAFKLVGITVGLLVRSHSLGILMSAYGGSRSIYSNFLGRGRNIIFTKNTAMDIGIGGRTARSTAVSP